MACESSAKTARKKLILQESVPTAWLEDKVQYLGATATSTGRRKKMPTPKSNDCRLQKAITRSRLIDAASLPFGQLITNSGRMADGKRQHSHTDLWSRTVALLSTVPFPLPKQSRFARLFALSKANFGCGVTSPP